MVRYEEEPFDAGSMLADEAVEHVSRSAERYCAHECDRITLANEPRINELKIESHGLMEVRSQLADRLRRMPVPAAPRKAGSVRYYAAVSILLTLAAFAFTLIGFDPYRLGMIGVLYCFGIALVTPFAVHEFLEHWNAEYVLKAVGAVVFGATILGGMLLASVRGDLFARKASDARPAVVIEEADTGQDAKPVKPSFYESNETALRLLMLLFALGIDLGAGIAFHQALREQAVPDVNEREFVERELAAVRLRLQGIAFELTALENGPHAFASRFWRDFYRVLVTKTARNAIAKGLGFTALACALWTHPASTADPWNIVAALDLSQSEGVKGTDGRTPFERNVAAITRFLPTAPAGARITVIAIRKDSLADPYPLLSAEISPDIGYFGERLEEARAGLVRAWRIRAGPLTPSESGTDILGALHLASELFIKGSAGYRNVLLLFSDMRNASPALNLEAPQSKSPTELLQRVEVQHGIAELANVMVYVVGANGGGRNLSDWRTVKDFWLAYFTRAGAKCEDYSALVQLPLLGR